MTQLTLPLLGGHDLGPLWNAPVTRAAKPRLRSEPRRRLLKRRTPRWANVSLIRTIYAVASRRGENVDHIIPLHHPLVSGLHVEQNLRIVPGLDNSRRRNSGWWPDAPFEQPSLIDILENKL